MLYAEQNKLKWFTVNPFHCFLNDNTITVGIALRFKEFVFISDMFADLTVPTGRAFSAMHAGMQASSSHSFTIVCLTPQLAANPPAAWKRDTVRHHITNIINPKLT